MELWQYCAALGVVGLCGGLVGFVAGLIVGIEEQKRRGRDLVRVREVRN